MNRRQKSTCCNRIVSERDLLLKHVGFDRTERAVLNISRYFWQAFASPGSNAWLVAIGLAEQHFGGNAAYKILSAVQAMRASRKSCFKFNNPECDGCSAIVSEHEQQFMNTFISLRQRRNGPARTHAMILCEGQDTKSFIEKMTVLAETFSAIGKPELNEKLALQIH